MSISITDYLNNTVQNTWTTSAEKEKQQNTAETGKTQESAVSASLDQVNLGEDGIAVAQVSRQQGAAQTGAQSQSAPRTDTVEISAAGKAASSAVQSLEDDGTETDAYEYEAEDLSEYTDSELKQMYYNGEITLQEYEDETGETLE